MIRLVVTDLDGTFLGPQKEISMEARKTVSLLKERDIFFTFITGRPPYAVKRFSDLVGIDGPIVSCNGAIIYKEDKILTRHSFMLAPLQELMEQAAKMGLTVLYYLNDVEFTLSETAWTKQRKNEGRPVPVRTFTQEEWGSLAADKLNIMAGEISGFAALYQEFAWLKKDYSISFYGDMGCEIVADGINKATGLLELCEMIKISPKEVLAVGDNENDIEMLKLAGIGAAVANASDAAKESADYVCKNACTDGVVEAICRFT